MTTALKYFANRDSVIQGMRWIGSNASYGAIKHWARAFVERDSAGNLFLQGEEMVDLVPVGDYIVLVSGSFYHFSPEELLADYIEVKD